jgi:hypothetical protein
MRSSGVIKTQSLRYSSIGSYKVIYISQKDAYEIRLLEPQEAP